MDADGSNVQPLVMDYARRRVTVGGRAVGGRAVGARAVALTQTESRLLCEPAVNAGQTLSRERLMNRVWSAWEPDDSGVVQASVKRHKLGKTTDNPGNIFYEPRVGYRMAKGKVSR